MEEVEASKRAAMQELLSQLAETRTQKKEELIRSVGVSDSPFPVCVHDYYTQWYSGVNK